MAQSNDALAIAKARALLEAVDFDSNGIMVGNMRQGGNGGILSRQTLKAADDLRRALDQVGTQP